MTPDVRVVAAAIVNYNGGRHLVDCIASLRAEGVDRIVVADNGSTDDSLGELENADPAAAAAIVHNGRNLGYGGGVNRAASALRPAPPDAMLVCNPDTIVHPGTVKALVEALDADPTLGIVAPRIENPDGSTYPSARSFPNLGDAIGHAFIGLVAPNNRFSRRYKLLDRGHTEAGPVDWVSGACFLVRWSCWDDLHGFDESYFMYLEEVDLCWRAHQHGWGVGFEPSGWVTHIQGTATSRHPYRMILAHHRSVLKFANRTTTGLRRWLLPAMAAGLALRAGMACFIHWQAGWRRPRRLRRPRRPPGRTTGPVT